MSGFSFMGQIQNPPPKKKKDPWRLFVRTIGESAERINTGIPMNVSGVIRSPHFRRTARCQQDLFSNDFSICIAFDEVVTKKVKAKKVISTNERRKKKKKKKKKKSL